MGPLPRPVLQIGITGEGRSDEFRCMFVAKLGYQLLHIATGEGSQTALTIIRIALELKEREEGGGERRGRCEVGAVTHGNDYCCCLLITAVAMCITITTTTTTTNSPASPVAGHHTSDRRIAGGKSSSPSTCSPVVQGLGSISGEPSAVMYMIQNADYPSNFR